MATSTPALTARQSEMLDVIRSHMRDYGNPPTVREIGLAMGINSPNGVLCHVKALERKGVLSRVWNTSRSLRILADITPDVEALEALARMVVARAAPIPAEEPGDKPVCYAIYLARTELEWIRRLAGGQEEDRR